MWACRWVTHEFPFGFGWWTISIIFLGHTPSMVVSDSARPSSIQKWNIKCHYFVIFSFFYLLWIWWFFLHMWKFHSVSNYVMTIYICNFHFIWFFPETVAVFSATNVVDARLLGYVNYLTCRRWCMVA